MRIYVYPVIRILFFALFLGAAGGCGALFFVIHNQCIDFSRLEHYNPGSPTILLDHMGDEWARFQLDRREPVPYEKLPKHLVQAFLAAEDWNFFHHSGISWKGIIRSFFVNLYHGRRVQGASTITQQLVKLLFLDSSKTFERKIKEQICAVLVERQFTKEQILQTYVNHVCFGCGIYGVQAASQRFWGKDVADITVDEAATLAGIVQRPAKYCPLSYPLSAQKRRDSILAKMCKLNFIDQDVYEQVVEKELEVCAYTRDLFAPHLKETIRQFLEKEFGTKQVYSGGLVVHTTFDTTIQKHAETSFRTKQLQLQQEINPGIDGGLIAIDVASGGIRALVGGGNFVRSKFNRALQARRQMGSIFKPLVYAAAMQQGKTFADIKVDEPFHLEQNGQVWSPRNFNRRFNGPITIAYALSHSNNIATIKTFLDIGSEPVIELAKKCNIDGPFHPYPSLALGCVDATLYEAVGMFNVFANGGVYVQPYCIVSVKDKWGNKIWKHEAKSWRVMDTRVVGKVAKVLAHGLHRVHKIFPNEWINCDAISKTGTTNDHRTCWFAGSTPTLTTAVYIGRDDNQPMGEGIYPIRTAFPIWLQMNNKISFDTKHFVYDPSLHEIHIDEVTGEQVAQAKGKNIVSIFV